jgi:hypothetical protein
LSSSAVHFHQKASNYSFTVHLLTQQRIITAHNIASRLQVWEGKLNFKAYCERNEEAGNFLNHLRIQRVSYNPTVIPIPTHFNSVHIILLNLLKLLCTNITVPMSSKHPIQSCFPTKLFSSHSVFPYWIVNSKSV